MQPKVFIIVLNWNGKHNTEECLVSLRNIDYDNFNVVVIDNGSQDDSVNYLCSKFPEVHFIVNKRNTGFAEGNNIGMRYAVENGADYVFLLNNDAVVDKNVLSELVGVASQSDKIAIVGPKIYNYYEKNKIESAGYSYSLLKSKTYPIGYGEEDLGQYNSIREVSFISGCAMFVKVSKIHSSNLFDPYFFAYCEDLDLCHTILNKGDKLVYAPNAIVWHKVSASTGGYKSYLSVYLFTKNRINFVLKHGTLFQKLFFFAYLFFYYLPAFTVYSTLSGGKQTKAFYTALLSFVFKNLRYYEFEHVQGDKLKVGINARYIQRKVTGIEKYILQSLTTLSKKDFQNDYVLFLCNHAPGPKFNFRNNFKKFVTSFPTRSTFARIIWEQFWLSREIKKENINLFHGTSFVLPFFKPCKYVLTIYDLSYLYYPESYTFLNRLYYLLFLKHSIKIADRIIAISEAAKNEIMHEFGVGERKISVIYPSVDEHFGVIRKSTAQIFVEQNYLISSPFFIFVGSLIPRKNLVRIIKAFDKIKNNVAHKLIIIGKRGWLYDEIFETVRILNLQNRVVFTNYVSEQDLPLFYNAADALIFTSLHEGFGIPILEAMACGCPVITSNKSSMPEVAGDAAVLVDPIDIDEIADAMMKIVEDEELRKKLVNKGFERAKLFSWENSAKKLLDVYESV